MNTVLIAFLALLTPATDSLQHERDSMVLTQIEQRGITDVATLRAMRTVPRHLFVSDNQWSEAYDDRPLPIGYGQTISQPYIVAYMTAKLHPRHGQRILEIGTGSGYQAAVLATIIDTVYTVEIIRELCSAAASRLRALDYGNVVVKAADGFYGWKEHAPFDAIIVTAAAEYIPPLLLEQLKDGGVMIIPVGSPFMIQTLMLVEKRGPDIRTRSLLPVQFVPFRRAN